MTQGVDYGRGCESRRAGSVSPSILSDDDVPAAKLLVWWQLNLLHLHQIRINGRQAKGFPAPQLQESFTLRPVSHPALTCVQLAFIFYLHQWLQATTGYL